MRVELQSGVCYAAHYIQVGVARVSWVGVRMLSNGGLSLEPFEQEQERTIFFSGTIRLYNDAYPLTDNVEESLSSEQCSELLNAYDHWQLDFTHTQ